jgi:TP901 family phage tail tape measure protein
MANQDLIVRISGDIGRFQDSLKQVKKQTENMERTLSSVAKISGVAFAGLTASIGLNVREFAKFDNQLRSVKTLLSENSFGAKGLEQGFKEMREEALKLQAQTPSSIEAVNKALFDTVSAGVEASKAVEFVGVASKLAVAGVTDVSIATDGMTSALNAYQFAASEANAVAAKFFTAQKFGKTTIAELSQGFGLVGASASALGVSFDELLASISAATLAGVKTNAAYTGMKAVLAGISKPTKEAQEEAKRLGIQFNAAALRTKGLSKFLQDLTSTAGFTQDSLIQLFGSTEAQNIMFALTGSQAKAFKETLAELGNETKAVGTFNKAFETQNASLANQMALLGKQIQTVAIRIGEVLAPYVAKVTKQLSSLLDVFARNPEMAAFAATALGVSAAVAGLTTAVAAGSLAYIKLNNIIAASEIRLKAQNALMVAQEAITKLSTVSWRTLGSSITFANIQQKAFTVALVAEIALQKAAAVASNLMAVGFRAVGIAFKLALGPIGLITTAVAALVIYFKDDLIKVAQDVSQWFGEMMPKALKFFSASLNGVIAVIKHFVSNAINYLGGYGELLVGIFTLDKSKITGGLSKMKDAVVDVFTKTGEEASKAFNSSLTLEAPDIGKLRAGQNEYDEYKKKKAEEEKKRLAEDNAEKKRANEQYLMELRSGQDEYSEYLKQKKEEEKYRLLEIQNELKEERRALLMEQLEADAEFQAMEQEQKDEFLALNQERLINEIQTERDMRNQALAERLASERKTDQKFIKDKLKFGKTYAEINRILHSETLTGFKTAGQELVQLQRSNNSALKSIGKAFAISDIIMKTAQSAMNIYNGFSTIPIVGPALGVAGAAAAVAFGAEQIGQVKGAAKGGLMTGGIAGVDSIPTMLTPGELVAPERNFDEVVNAVADSRRLADDEGQVTGGVVEHIIGFTDDAFEIIEQRLLERRAIGVGGI